jgi:hypothetical protein
MLLVEVMGHITVREKGATSPDKAMTLGELGLPNTFEEVV